MSNCKEVCEKCMGYGWVPHGQPAGSQNWVQKECDRCDGEGKL